MQVHIETAENKWIELTSLLYSRFKFVEILITVQYTMPTPIWARDAWAVNWYKPPFLIGVTSRQYYLNPVTKLGIPLNVEWRTKGLLTIGSKMGFLSYLGKSFYKAESPFL